MKVVNLTHEAETVSSTTQRVVIGWQVYGQAGLDTPTCVVVVPRHPFRGAVCKRFQHITKSLVLKRGCEYKVCSGVRRRGLTPSHVVL